MLSVHLRFPIRTSLVNIGLLFMALEIFGSLMVVTNLRLQINPINALQAQSILFGHVAFVLDHILLFSPIFQHLVLQLNIPLLLDAVFILAFK